MLNRCINTLIILLLIFINEKPVFAEIIGMANASINKLTNIHEQVCCLHSVKLVAKPLRGKKYSYKLDVKGGDPGLFPHHRAEIFVENNESKPGKEYWYGWSTYIPTDWVNDPKWVLIAQWHTKSREVLQPLQLQLNDNRWCWINWIGKSPNAEYNLLWCGNIDKYKGHWVDWVVHVKWSNHKNGFFHIWMNGKTILNIRKKNIYKDYSPYWKVGLVYSSSDKHNHTIYIDELRMGNEQSSYNEVVPR